MLTFTSLVRAGWYLGATLQYPRIPESTKLEDGEESDEEEEESDYEEDVPSSSAGTDEYEELAKKYQDFKMVRTLSLCIATCAFS
jgi:hypothetical protein